MFEHPFYAVDVDKNGEPICGKYYAFHTKTDRDRFIVDGDEDMEPKDVACIEEVEYMLHGDIGHITWSRAPYDGYVFTIKSKSLTEGDRDFLTDHWSDIREIMNT